MSKLYEINGFKKMLALHFTKNESLCIIKNVDCKKTVPIKIIIMAPWSSG